MSDAPPVDVALAPSRTALVAIGVAAVVTGSVMLTLPWPPLATAAIIAAIFGWAADSARVVALRRGARSVRRVEISAGLRIRARFGDGTTVVGRVEPATCVTWWITTLVWRPEDARFARSVLIVPDMLPADDFRRLRVLLRYGRSDAAQGAPASQA